MAGTPVVLYMHCPGLLSGQKDKLLIALSITTTEPVHVLVE